LPRTTKRSLPEEHLFDGTLEDVCRYCEPLAIDNRAHAPGVPIIKHLLGIDMTRSLPIEVFICPTEARQHHVERRLGGVALKWDAGQRFTSSKRVAELDHRPTQLRYVRIENHRTRRAFCDFGQQRDMIVDVIQDPEAEHHVALFDPVDQIEDIANDEGVSA